MDTSFTVVAAGFDVINIRETLVHKNKHMRKIDKILSTFIKRCGFYHSMDMTFKVVTSGINVKNICIALFRK